MKKIFFIPIIGFTLLSCVDDTPKCDSEEVKSTVLEIIKEARLKSLDNGFTKTGNEELIQKGLDTMTLNLITTKSINKEIKNCECQGVISGYPLNSDEIIEFFRNDINIKDHEININFSAQTTEKGKTIVNLEPINIFN